MFDSDMLHGRDPLPLRHMADVPQLSCKQGFVSAVKAAGVSDTQGAHRAAKSHSVGNLCLCF